MQKSGKQTRKGKRKSTPRNKSTAVLKYCEIVPPLLRFSSKAQRLCSITMAKLNPTADPNSVLASVAADEEDGLAERLREGASEGDAAGLLTGNLCGDEEDSVGADTGGVVVASVSISTFIPWLQCPNVPHMKYLLPGEERGMMVLPPL